MFECKYCGQQFKNQGGLNLHLHKSSCKEMKNIDNAECEHSSSRLLKVNELNLISETGIAIKDLGYHSVCLKCGELIK
jgi:hypothetical protein